MDISALMGYTGAVFREFFETSTGIAISFIGLSVWAIVPLTLSLRRFKKTDL